MIKNAKAQLNYPDFIDFVKEHILDYIGEYIKLDTAARVAIAPVLKNNETIFDALQVSVDGRHQSAAIDLNRFYQDYYMEGDLPGVMRALAKAYVTTRDQACFIPPEEVASFGLMKDKIVIRLVSREKNVHLLETCPYREFMDLAITYRILSGKTAGGISTVLVTSRIMEQWGITEPVLYELAIKNSMRLFPPQIRSMEALLSDGLELGTTKNHDRLTPKDCRHIGLYIATNDCGLNGASVICYPDVFKDFAAQMGTDFYIIPSSIHEVILLSANTDMTPQMISEMISSANREVVASDDFLSDSVYWYCAGSGKIGKKVWTNRV